MNRACRNCGTIVKDEKVCPKCGSEDFTDEFGGELIVLNPEKSEIAKFLGFNAVGRYAVNIK